MNEETVKACEHAAGIEIAGSERSELGMFSFSKLLPVSRELQTIFRALGRADLAVPESVENEVFHRANQLIEWLTNRMRGFRVPPSEIPKRHEETVSEFLKYADETFRALAPLAAYSTSGSPQVAEQSARTAALVAEMQVRRNEVEQLVKQIEATYHRATELATATTISAHKDRFAEQAKLFGSLAFRWLLATIATASAALLFAGYVWLVTPPDLPGEWPYIVAKLTVFSILLSLTWWSGRMYRSSEHNRVVNEHRAIALATFEAFVDGASPEIRNAILMQTTACIFSPQPTGLVPNEPDPHPIAFMVDAVRTATSQTNK